MQSGRIEEGDGETESESRNMETTNRNRHLTLEERRIIEQGIRNGSRKSAIAETLGKDKSTIGKEIAAHRILKHRCTLDLECSAYRYCKYGRQCTKDCPGFVQFTCSRRDRSPGACNGCGNYTKCRFSKYEYVPEEAHSEYRRDLVDSRQGVNMTASEAKAIADIVGPLLKQGQSPYTILSAHPELGICERTLYNYIESDVFRFNSDISVLQLRRQASRSLPKKKANEYKKRNDYRYLQGRKYGDYLEYMKENTGVHVTEMDTVYNDGTNGPFMQTFRILDAGILLALYHERKDAATMTEGLRKLAGILGPDVFRRYCSVILTDRGCEFSAAEDMETSADGTRMSRIFYCDPMQSGQKGSLENNHIELRYILPKETDLRGIGLDGQEALNLALSHINSMPVRRHGGKSPMDVTGFMFPDLYAKLLEFGIRQIPPDDIVLKPYLLKKKK